MHTLQIIKNVITQAAEGDFLKEPYNTFTVSGFVGKDYKQERFDTETQAIAYVGLFVSTKET